MAIYYKLLRKHKKHHNHQYDIGVNHLSGRLGEIIGPQVDPIPIPVDSPWSSTDISVRMVGLSFSTLDSVWSWLNLYTDIYWLAELRLTSTSVLMDIGGGNYVTDCMEIIRIEPLTNITNAIARKSMIYSCKEGFTFLSNPTEEEAICAVRRFGHLLQFIKHPSKLICETAVKSDPYAIQYIPESPLKEELWKIVPLNIKRYFGKFK